MHPRAPDMHLSGLMGEKQKRGIADVPLLSGGLLRKCLPTFPLLSNGFLFPSSCLVFHWLALMFVDFYWTQRYRYICTPAHLQHLLSTCTHAHTHAHKHMHAHAYSRSQAHARTRILTFTSTCTHAHTHAHKHIHKHIATRIHTPLGLSTCARTRIHTHSQPYCHAHTHTHFLFSRKSYVLAGPSLAHFIHLHAIITSRALIRKSPIDGLLLRVSIN